jgi:hypothetical protein
LPLFCQANLFFQLVSSRYEHASLVLTSNLAFSRWGEVFSDATVASAMIDRIVHHAEVLNLTGRSYRLRNRTKTQLQAHFIPSEKGLPSMTVISSFPGGPSTMPKRGSVPAEN